MKINTAVYDLFGASMNYGRCLLNCSREGGPNFLSLFVAISHATATDKCFIGVIKKQRLAFVRVTRGRVINVTVYNVIGKRYFYWTITTCQIS